MNPTFIHSKTFMQHAL